LKFHSDQVLHALFPFSSFAIITINFSYQRATTLCGLCGLMRLGAIIDFCMSVEKWLASMTKEAKNM
jgi:hypothetical protein